MAVEEHPAVYIMANRTRGTIYVGVTSALWSRVCDQKNGTAPGFTSAHGVKTLVWYEQRQTMEAAIRRQKQIKSWQRAWKIRLIETANPAWRDLHDGIDALATLVGERTSPACRHPGCSQAIQASWPGGGNGINDVNQQQARPCPGGQNSFLVCLRNKVNP